jgi:hypothetical protein
MDKKTDLSHLVQTRKFDPSEEIKEQLPLIRINDKIILTEENFITISGLPKSRKTTFMNMFIASAVKGQPMFGINVGIKKNEKVCIVDTEQSKSDFNRQYKYLKNVCYPSNPSLIVDSYLFRQDEPSVILNAISLIMERDKPKLLFIDNLTELVLNFNDITECKKVIQFFKTITAKYKCGVVCLIHLNKGNGLTQGNLGSFADKASQSVLKVELDVTDSNSSILSASALRSDAKFEPINIFFNEDTKRYELRDFAIAKPIQDSKVKFSMDIFTKEDLTSRLDITFDNQDSFTYKALCEQLKKSFGRGDNAIKQVVIPYLMGKKLLKHKNDFYIRN